MDQNRILFVLILLIILFFPNSPNPGNRDRTDNILLLERHQLDQLRSSTFGHPGNLTRLLSSENPTPPGHNTSLPTPPPQVRERWRSIRDGVLQDFGSSNGQLRMAQLPVYVNATGSLTGDWKKLSIPGVNASPAMLSNVTYPNDLSRLTTGKLWLSIEETMEPSGGSQRNNSIEEVKIALRIKSPAGNLESDVRLNGVHFTDNGEMVASSTSERFAGIFALPHFMFNTAMFNRSKELLVLSLEKSIKRMEDSRFLDAPWISATEAASASAVPKCEYLLYLQLHPVDAGLLFSNINPGAPNQRLLSAFVSKTLKEIEHELRFPTGLSLPRPPPLIATAMVYSPNCGFVLEANGLKGQKEEQFYAQASNFGLGAAAVTTIQIWLLMRQMNESNTPSMMNRVSFWTIAMMAVVDGCLFFAFMLVAVVVRVCFIPLVTASFCYLMLSAVFGMRFLAGTYKAQLQPIPQPPPAITSSRLPIPATATPQTPLTVPPVSSDTTPNQTAVSDLSTLHVRFYFALFGLLTFTLYASTWSPLFRDPVMYTLLIITNSCWIPQVHRNVMRGCRKPFRWEFVFGTSLCRLIGVFYLYLYPGNIFATEPSPRAVSAITGWMWLQCLMLFSQDILGPRFFLPTDLIELPIVYDYHAPLPISDEESIVQDMGTPANGGRKRSFDCVICVQNVEVPAAGGDTGNMAEHGLGLMARRGYMITPCRHVFHSHCLEGWMRFRLQCPICRTALPAL